MNILNSDGNDSTKSQRAEMVYFKISRHSWFIVKIIALVLSIMAIIFGLWMGMKTGNWIYVIAAPVLTALGICWSLSALIAVIANTIVKPRSWERMKADDWGPAIFALVYGIVYIILAWNLIGQAIK